MFFQCGQCCESDPVEGTREGTLDPMVQISEHTQSVFSGTASSASAARGRDPQDKPAPEPGIRDSEESRGSAGPPEFREAAAGSSARETKSEPTPGAESPPLVEDQSPMQQLANFSEPVKDIGPTPADEVPRSFTDPGKPDKACDHGQGEGGRSGRDDHDDTHDYEDVSEEGSLAGTGGCGWKVNRSLKRMEKKVRSRSASPGEGLGWKVNNVLAPIEAKFTIAPPHTHHPEPPAPPTIMQPGMGWKLEERLSKAESKYAIIRPHAKPSQEEQEAARMINLLEHPQRPGVGWLVEGQLAAMEKRMKERVHSPDGKPRLGWKVNDRLMALEVQHPLFKGGHHEH